jgi:hypothetical protein
MPTLAFFLPLALAVFLIGSMSKQAKKESQKRWGLL